ncbi:MAG TPA: hypothetical protein VM686_02770 [Polyangiaceae bacterium]|nr:hypothetical protein [Polyangiaceae bacterium]
MASRYSALLALLLIACSSGSSDDDDNGPKGMAGSSSTLPDGFIDCGPDTLFHLTGDVDGEVIEVTEAPTLGGFSQQSNPPGPHFSLPNPDDPADEAVIQVFLTWAESVASGEVTPIEGWLRLPSDLLAGETICAGAGSEMMMPPSAQRDARGEFLFSLRGLSRGADCDQAVSGELDGCWRN